MDVIITIVAVLLVIYKAHEFYPVWKQYIDAFVAAHEEIEREGAFDMVMYDPYGSNNK